MHRGSSKGARDPRRPPDNLPLSASPAAISVVVEVTRGGSVERQRIRVAPGTLVRAVLRSTGHAPEGSAVLVNEVPIPLDTPIDRSVRLTVIPTFSGG
jgi:sulfur carrier protein ThiS